MADGGGRWSGWWMLVVMADGEGSVDGEMVIPY